MQLLKTAVYYSTIHLAAYQKCNKLTNPTNMSKLILDKKKLTNSFSIKCESLIAFFHNMCDMHTWTK